MNLNPLSLAIVNPRGAGVAAALFEDFTNSAVDFDSSITFTRGSQATYFDSTGTLKFAPSNMIRNNTMVGASAPSTLPTNWLQANSTGLAFTIAGIGTENRIDYVDLTISGTTTGTGQTIVYFDGLAQIVASNTETWTHAAFVKLQGGSTTNITSVAIGVLENTAAGATVTFGQSTITPTSAQLSTYRPTLTRTLSGGATVARIVPFLQIAISTGLAVNITLRIGLPQLQMGSEATPAIRTSGSAVYLPRSNAYQDYNPSTLAPLGFLIEEQRTNSIRNNTMVGAAAGTPGTLPTNWVTSLSGLTRTIVGSSTVNGINYIDIRFNGTTSSGSGIEIKLDGNASISGASASQAWSQSVWVSVVGGSTTNITSSTLVFNEYSVGPAYLRTTTCASNILAGGATLTRVSGSGTTGALTTIIEPIMYLGASSGVAIDITLRIGLPQLELGAFATSVIKTTAAAATRLADSASITGTNFSQWWNASAGTFVAAFSLLSATAQTATRGIVMADDNSTANRVGQFIGSTGAAIANRITTGGVANAPFDVGSLSASSKNVAIAFESASGAACFEGGAVATSSPTVPIPANRLRIGNTQNGNEYLNGHIQRLSYYRARLSNASLQSLTT
jgi:hypothetical protein